VLILLPPSEGKTAPADGPRPEIASLSFPALNPLRTKLLAELIRVCAKDPQAASILGLGPRQLDEITVNAHLRKAACAPAIEVYTGVLYDALDVHSLRKAERARLQRSTAIASALFGLVRPDDLIPAYRLSGDVSLLGSPAAYWRDAISVEIAKEKTFILDLRSQAYAACGPIPAEAQARSAVGRVLTERGGKRTVVSHFNKASKGRLVRAVAQSGAKGLDDLLELARELDWKAELTESTKGPATLDLIVPEL